MRAHATGQRHPHHLHIGEFLQHHVFPFIKKNAVLFISLFAAAITACIVPPNKAYLDYFDWKTLTCLFCVLAVVCALKNIRFFFFLAQKIVRAFKNSRACVLALAYVTFIGSMLIANDMALLTFLPLGYFVLSSTGKKKYMAFTFIIQNIAANLGGMLTPFGNPQNLYLYNEFSIPTGDFILTMLTPFLISVALITLSCFLFVKKEALEIEAEKICLPVWRTIVYALLFTLSIVIVFRAIPFWIGLIVIPIVLLFLDRKALGKVDYGLLLTFMAFFIFSGNMSNIPQIQRLFGYLMDKNALLVSTFSCQFISNVPSAILLSQFTDSYREILLGVNIGGCGTLISSLASLITFREYTKHDKGGTKKYLLLFSAFNFAFLAILLGACILLTL
ncbi:MAG: citrate transporter [Clostridia bacterium]|nr:citrate transporter [Clostridia bacterium]